MTANADPARAIVTLDHLEKKYGQFTAVDRISLEVPYGTVFGVLGPNGAGKTTTLRMITGLLRPTAGSIVIDGHDMDKDPVAAKTITGFIPDRPYIYDKLTAFEYLRFIGGLYKLSGKMLAGRIPEMLELFELREWSDTLIESFSHGMKQRLVFSGALLPGPKLLVVDEPMVGLDPKGHKLVKSLFRRLAEEEDMTILLSTHTLEVAEEICDQIVIINHGRIIARGTLSELRIESGEGDGSLEEVFLRLTEEKVEERDAAVAERFGKAPASVEGKDGDLL
ncbi:MAG: ABC transporter ATP-binding protein [Bradymonadaceae bacterium]